MNFCFLFFFLGHCPCSKLYTTLFFNKILFRIRNAIYFIFNWLFARLLYSSGNIEEVLVFEWLVILPLKQGMWMDYCPIWREWVSRDSNTCAFENSLQPSIVYNITSSTHINYIPLKSNILWGANE